MRKASKTFFVLTTFILILAVMACNRVPDNVIQPDKMAELLADIRVADAVVNIHKKDYESDESKLALKEAIFKRHGVTQEMFDSSLVWYGHHIDKYHEVNKHTLEILEQRLKDVGRTSAGASTVSVSGDSVDIWDMPRVFSIDRRSPTQYITFGFQADENWKPGDVYTLRSHMFVAPQYARWNLTAIYSDGTVETITSNISLENPAKQELVLVTDSTRTTELLSGWINIEPVEGKIAIVDSLGLMRRRNSPEMAKLRKYAQKRIVAKTEENDTLSK